jgi:hypothetical protein
MKNNPWADAGRDSWLSMSGKLETPNSRASIDRLGRLSGTDMREVLLPVLMTLKTDERIHLVKAEIPEWLYVNGLMTWSTHRPDDGSPRLARSA